MRPRKILRMTSLELIGTPVKYQNKLGAISSKIEASLGTEATAYLVGSFMSINCRSMAETTA